MSEEVNYDENNESAEVTEQIEQEQPSVHRMQCTGNIDSKLLHGIRDGVSDIKQGDAMIIEHCSNGGSPEYMNVINEIFTAKWIPILTIALGRCCSAAQGYLALNGAVNLCYTSTVYMQHQPKFNVEMVFLEDVDHIRQSSIELQDLFRQRIQFRAGLSDEELEMLFSKFDVYFSSLDALMMGTKGLVDGIIYRELGKRKWIVLTRSGFKLFQWPGQQLDERPLMTEEELLPYGLKPFTPLPVVKAFERQKKK